MPKSLIGQPFRESINSDVEKLYASESYVTISFEVFGLTVPKNFVGEPFCYMFQKFPEAKKFMDKREEEVSRFSVEKLLYHGAETSHRATL